MRRYVSLLLSVLMLVGLLSGFPLTVYAVEQPNSLLSDADLEVGTSGQITLKALAAPEAGSAIYYRVTETEQAAPDDEAEPNIGEFSDAIVLAAGAEGFTAPVVIDALTDGLVYYVQVYQADIESGTITAFGQAAAMPTGDSASETEDDGTITVADGNLANDNLWRLWYDEPANVVLTEGGRSWQRQSLAIGNGHMGALLFGGVARERMHFDEKTWWPGGPTADSTTGKITNSQNYIFGNRGRENPSTGNVALPAITSEEMAEIRADLDDRTENVFGLPQDTTAERRAVVNKVAGDNSGYGSTQGFGDLYLDFARAGITSETEFANYVRDLEMDTGLAHVQYEIDGVTYTKEYLSSYPDNVTAIKLTASQPGKLTFDALIQLEAYSRNKPDVLTQLATLEEDEDPNTESATLTLKSALNTNSNASRNIEYGLRGQASTRIVATGGTLATSTDLVSGLGNTAFSMVNVTEADEVIIYFACGTDYKNEYPDYRTFEDPGPAIIQRLDAAQAKGYAAIKKDHVDDHSELFNRMDIDLGQGDTIPQDTTDVLIKKYRQYMGADLGLEEITHEERAALESMAYQFGRYLTIAGSRPGALPTNLQGVWGIGGYSWGGDYHMNINEQMNYWPTLASNLAESLLPLNDFIESLRVPGRVNVLTATGLFDNELTEIAAKGKKLSDRGAVDEYIQDPIGWMVHCFTNPFGLSGQNQNNLAGWNPTGSAWIMQNVYDYYRYTGDKDYLKDNIYPNLKELADFWTEYLWWSPTQERYVVTPSISPEQGPVTIGTTYDQMLIWQLFEETIDAAEILGVDADRIAVWKDYQSKLDPIMVGEDGQVKEWYEETTFANAAAGDISTTHIPDWRSTTGTGASATDPHRHISHLIGMYPGTLISKDSDEYMDAAMVTLNERGFLGTGWSKIHKMTLWARAQRAEETYALVQSMMGGGNIGFLENLFASHGSGGTHGDANPVFQIDANYGFTAGVNEMLLQSQLGYTQFLPALPGEWATGSIKGIVARGNFEINMEWADMIATKFEVKSRAGGEFIGEYTGIGSASVTASDGSTVAVTKTNDRISFDTQKGVTYTITGFQASTEAELASLTYTRKENTYSADMITTSNPDGVLGEVIRTEVIELENGKTTYSAVVPHSFVTSGTNDTVTISAAATNGQARLDMSNAAVTLVNGTGQGSVTVIAGDGKTAKTYTVSFTTAPSTGVSISPKHTSLVLGASETATLTLDVPTGVQLEDVQWNTSDSSIVSIPKDANGKNVLITGLKEGSVTITATFGKFTATATVDVFGPIVATDNVDILTDKATINKAKEQGALIDIRIYKDEVEIAGDTGGMVNIAAEGDDTLIESVSVTGAPSGAEFIAQVVSDRQVSVTASVTTPNRTFKDLGLSVKFKNGVTIPTGATLQLTVQEAYPKITLKATQLNRFFSGSKGTVTGTAADGSAVLIDKIETANSQAASIVEILPDEKSYTAIANGSASLKVTINLDGYKQAYKTGNTATVTAKVVNTAPKLKLSPASITLGGTLDTQINLLPNSSKDDLAGYGRVVKVTAKRAADADATELAYANGKITIPASLNGKPGKTVIAVTFAGSTTPVNTNLTIKSGNLAKASISSKTKSFTINKAHNGVFATIDIVPNITNLDLTLKETAAVPGISITQLQDNQLQLAAKSDDLKVGKHTVEIKATAPGITGDASFAKTLKLTVNVTDKAAGYSVSLKNKIDVLNPASAVTATVKLTNTLSTLNDVELTGPDADKFVVPSKSGNTFVVTKALGKMLTPGAKYILGVNINLANGQRLTGKTITITPTQPSVKVTQSAKEVNLYKSTPTQAAALNVSLPSSTIGIAQINEASIAKNPYFEVIDSGDGNLSLKFAEGVDMNVLKASYTVKIELWVEDTYDILQSNGKPIALGTTDTNGKFTPKTKPIIVSVKVNVK